MSNENKWTPTPWNTSYWIEQPNNRHKPMVVAGGVTIAIMHPAPVCQMSECEANAHLIAAAPELYEALEWAMNFVDQVRVENPAPKGGGEDIAYEEARAAIAKARGEQS